MSQMRPMVRSCSREGAYRQSVLFSEVQNESLQRPRNLNLAMLGSNAYVTANAQPHVWLVWLFAEITLARHACGSIRNLLHWSMVHASLQSASYLLDNWAAM